MTTLDTLLTAYAASPTAANRDAIAALFAPELTAEIATLKACVEKHQASIVRLHAELAAVPAMPAQVQVQQVPCWSCKRQYTASQRIDADGCCPYCGVEIELEVGDAFYVAATQSAESAQPAADMSAPIDERSLFGWWNKKYNNFLPVTQRSSAEPIEHSPAFVAGELIPLFTGRNVEDAQSAADWLRNNYQAYTSIGAICDALAARAAAPSQPTYEAQYDALRTAIITALGEHRMVHLYEMEDDGPGAKYPLVDQLSLEGGTIGSGKDEIEAIADAVMDVLDARAAAPVSGPLVGCSDGSTRVVMAPPTIWKSRLVAEAAPVSGPSDDDIERFALAYVAPQFNLIGPKCDYKQTEQFTRLKLFVSALQSAAPVSGQDASELPPLPAPTRRGYGLHYNAEEMTSYGQLCVDSRPRSSEVGGQGASIDTPEFRDLLYKCYAETYGHKDQEALIAHIHAWADSRAKVLEEALKFYAEQQHFVLHDPDVFDTISGEPQNWQEDEANTIMFEDGTVAKQALASTTPPKADNAN